MFGVSNLPDGRQAGLGHFDFSSISELIKSQISSIKLQINPKFQYSMTKTCLEFQIQVIYGFGILNFGHCNLFDIYDLLFVISGKEIPILLNY